MKKKNQSILFEKKFYLFSDYKMRILSSEWGNEIQEKKNTETEKQNVIPSESESESETHKNTDYSNEKYENKKRN